MGEWRIQRTNTTANLPRFEWLRSRPTFVPAGEPAPAGLGDLAEGSVSADDRVGGIRWTWRDPAFVAAQPGEVSGWRNGNAPRDFGPAKAQRWAQLIDGAHVVRHGEPGPEETIDLATIVAERGRAARRAYREALAAGTAEDLS